MSNFDSRIRDIATSAKEASDAIIKTGNPKWFKPVDGKPGDPFDWSTIKDAYSRDSLVTDYNTAINSEGKVKTTQKIKIQGDMLSALERDIKLRYKTRERTLAHLAAKLGGVGSDKGPLLNGIIRFVNKLFEE